MCKDNKNTNDNNNKNNNNNHNNKNNNNTKNIFERIYCKQCLHQKALNLFICF